MDDATHAGSHDAVAPRPPPAMLRSRTLLGLAVLSAGGVACADATAPSAARTPTAAQLAKSSTSATKPDTSRAPTPAPGGSGGSSNGGGGGSAAVACGTLSATIQTYDIVVYTTRIGIGFSGTATNCGGKKAAFEVDVVDTDPDPSCTVDVPHFIAAKNTDPGATVVWSANSTLVPCMGRTHHFVLTLWDTKTRTKLATAAASAFL